jgi:hypothetical protein
MKKLLLTMTAALVCVGAFGQGKLAFQLYTTGLIYFTTDTTQLLPADASKQVGGFALAGSGAYTGAGSTIASLAGSPSFVVALYGGATAGSLSLQTTTTIATYGAEGTLASVNAAFASLVSATPAFFQIEVYDSRAANAPAAWLAGEYAGETGVFTATPQPSTYSPIYQATAPVSSTLPTGTGTLTDYPGVHGLIPLYAVVPEPTTFALAGLGLASLMIFRRRQ